MYHYKSRSDFGSIDDCMKSRVVMSWSDNQYWGSHSLLLEDPRPRIPESWKQRELRIMMMKTFYDIMGNVRVMFCAISLHNYESRIISEM